jgi:hypothetical protein
VPDAVAKTPGLEVKRDGMTIGSAAWGTPVPVDPGDHSVEVAATGKKPWSKTISIRVAASRENLSVPPLENAAVVEVAARPDASGHGLSALQQTGLVAGGLGIIALGVGTYFGIDAIRKNARSNGEGCTGDMCEGAGYQTRLEARTSGTVSTLAFVGGGVFVVGGAIMYFAGGDASPNRGAIRAVPSASRSEIGLLVRGSF